MIGRTIILFILVPFLGSAQFNLEIVAIDLDQYTSIPDVHFAIGNRSIGSHEYAAKFNNIDIELLDDTLFIEHVNYIFNSVPLADNEYTVHENTIRVHVYGRPWKHNQVHLNLDIARSKKIKNDSVQVQLGSFGDPALITFEPSSKKRKKKTITSLLNKVPYDHLENGDNVMTTSLQTTHAPFKKWEWFQTACLYQHKTTRVDKKELFLLKAYFQTIEQAKIEKRKATREHEKQLDSLHHEIEDRDREINRLKGFPVDYAPHAPELEDEYQIVEFYDFVHIAARPSIGYDSFKEKLAALIATMSTDFSGNITLEIAVHKHGMVTTKILHAGADKLEVVQAIQAYVKELRWEPAMQSGSNTESTVIVSVNIGPVK